MTLQQLSGKVGGANRAFQAGQSAMRAARFRVMAGQTLQSPTEIGNILITARDGRPVYVRDVATVLLGADSNEWRATNVIKKDGGLIRVPAVSLAIAKRAGHQCRRHRGEHHRAAREAQGRSHSPRTSTSTSPATMAKPPTRRPTNCCSISASPPSRSCSLWRLSIGWREALVVAVVIPTTILLTLFAARVMGYTLNRVSLFALIFSIGILVDDAIVVIENIARHWAMKDGRTRTQAAIEAVAEVGNPDHRRDAHGGGRPAAHAVRVGPDGPLHEPHPGQCLGRDDLLVLRRGDRHALADDQDCGKPSGGHGHGASHGGLLGRMYVFVARPILKSQGPRLDFPACRRRGDTGLACPVLHQGCHGEAAALRQQVGTADRGRPAGRLSVEATDRVLQQAAERRCDHCPKSIRCRPMPAPPRPSTSTAWCALLSCGSRRSWAMCRSTWRRRASASRSSHDIALELREKLKGLDLPAGTVVKVSNRRPARRCWQPCWPKSTARCRDPPRHGCKGARGLRAGAFRRRRRRQLRNPGAAAARSPSTRTISSSRRWRSATSTTRCNRSMPAMTVGYSHRGDGRQPIPIALGLAQVRQGH